MVFSACSTVGQPNREYAAELNGRACFKQNVRQGVETLLAFINQLYSQWKESLLLVRRSMLASKSRRVVESGRFLQNYSADSVWVTMYFQYLI